jgi:tetratricopeptide (TPR) repeat protein
VASVLHCALAGDGQDAAVLDLESTRLYLSACDAVGEDADDTHVRDLLRALVKRNPGFASGWAHFALASASASQNLTGDEAVEAAAEARAAASRALQLDPKQGLAYAALETLAPATDLALRQNLIEKGLAASPNVAVLNSRESDILSEVGRVQDAIVFDQRAVTLDPLNPFFAADLAQNASMHGADVAARAMLARDVRIWPHADFIRGYQLGLEARYGDPAVALQMLSHPNDLPPMSDAQLADWRDFALTRQSGDKAKTDAYAARVLANLAGKRLSVGQALVRLISIGAVDAVYQAVAMASPEDPVETEPFFRSLGAPVRADPRFLPLMAKTGVLAFWRNTGHWADFCEAQDRPYDCRAEATKLGL